MAGQVDPIVSCEWLKDKIERNDVSDIRILDVTLDAKDKYDQGHIAGALYFDITYKAEHTEYLRRNIPKPEYVEEAAQAAGIDSDTHIVVYDASATNGFYFGARGWWTFYVNGHDRVSVLNGGIEKWIQNGYPLTQEIPTVQKGNFKSAFKSELIRSYEDMVENRKTMHYQLIDTRPAQQFHGTPDDAKSGHYPGAKSIPHPELLDRNTGLLKDLVAIKQMFAEQNIDLDKPVIGSCNTATSASTVALLAKVLGKPDVPLYLGSFQEWKRRAEDKDIERS